MKEPFRKEIWCLLKRNISKGQLLGYALANVVGLSVILIGTLFYADSQHSNSDSDAFFSEDYIVLSKKVDGIGFTPVRFTSDDISSLEQQKWVQKVGKFSVSQFAVNGSVDMGGRGLSTYLFFESVPDEFFDVLPSDWYFKPEEKFVPIIMSRDYLTLYNFGFAIPQGLPQVSDKMVGAVPITLQLTGEGNVTETYSAAVVGFSSRLNTIAVPQSFMDWANKRYYSGPPQEPSRLIVKIDRLAAADMERYLKEHDLEMAGDKGSTGNISAFLRVVSSVVATNGVVISALALFILTLSIFLLLQKSKDTIRKLMFMGFRPSKSAAIMRQSSSAPTPPSRSSPLPPPSVAANYGKGNWKKSASAVPPSSRRSVSPWPTSSSSRPSTSLSCAADFMASGRTDESPTAKTVAATSIS